MEKMIIDKVSFQKNPGTSLNRSWYQTYGAGVSVGVVKNGLCTSGLTSFDTTTICDVNLLKSDNKFYRLENILIHEYAHTLMNVGLTNGTIKERQWYQTINSIYLEDYLPGSCQNNNKQIYACFNAYEMWTEATQA